MPDATNSLPQIEPHQRGGWQVVVRACGTLVKIIDPDGHGLTKEQAEVLVEKLNAFLAERN